MSTADLGAIGQARIAEPALASRCLLLKRHRERSSASVGQSPSQFIREAILLRCAVAGGEVTDEIRRIATELRK
jgi:hypothetical protein